MFLFCCWQSESCFQATSVWQGAPHRNFGITTSQLESRRNFHPGEKLSACFVLGENMPRQMARLQWGLLLWPNSTGKLPSWNRFLFDAQFQRNILDTQMDFYHSTLYCQNTNIHHIPSMTTIEYRRIDHYIYVHRYISHANFLYSTNNCLTMYILFFPPDTYHKQLRTQPQKVKLCELVSIFT